MRRASHDRKASQDRAGRKQDERDDEVRAKENDRVITRYYDKLARTETIHCLGTIFEDANHDGQRNVKQKSSSWPPLILQVGLVWSAGIS